MTLGLLRRFLPLQVFTWLAGNVNSCLCFTTSGPRPGMETEVCVPKMAVNALWDLQSQSESEKDRAANFIT